MVLSCDQRGSPGSKGKTGASACRPSLPKQAAGSDTSCRRCEQSLRRIQRCSGRASQAKEIQAPLWYQKASLNRKKSSPDVEQRNTLPSMEVIIHWPGLHTWPVSEPGGATSAPVEPNSCMFVKRRRWRGRRRCGPSRGAAGVPLFVAK